MTKLCKQVEEWLLAKSFEHKLSYVKTSARTGLHVRQVFEQLAKLSGALTSSHQLRFEATDDDPFGTEQRQDVHNGATAAVGQQTRASIGSSCRVTLAPSAASSKSAKRRFSLQTHSTIGEL